MAYLVTNDRHAKTYVRFFKALIRATNGKWQPDLIMADLEAAIHAAIREAFGGRTKSRKCWFHIAKAVRKYTHQTGVYFDIYLSLVFISSNGAL